MITMDQGQAYIGRAPYIQKTENLKNLLKIQRSQVGF